MVIDVGVGIVKLVYPFKMVSFTAVTCKSPGSEPKSSVNIHSIASAMMSSLLVVGRLLTLAIQSRVDSLEGGRCLLLCLGLL